MYHRVKAESSLFSAFFRLTYGVICGRGVIRRGDSEKNADREQNLITREAYSFLSFFVFYANPMSSHNIPYSIRKCIIRYTMQRNMDYAIGLSCIYVYMFPYLCTSSGCNRYFFHTLHSFIIVF